MSNYKFESNVLTCKIELTSANVLATNRLLLDLITAVQEFNTQVPLQKIQFKYDSGDDYSYTIIASDGRQWSQVIRFDEMDDPGQSFDVTDFWRITEFKYHRTVRDLIISLHQEFSFTDAKFTCA